MNNTMKKITAALAMSSAAFAAQAAPIVLDFEGVGNFKPVGNFYADQGITFSPGTLAIVNADVGGNGDFANEPSPSTIMFFLDANNAILNFAAGFSTGFSFFYTSSDAAVVNLYDGVNGTGSLLGSVNLTAQYTDNCSGDPNGLFCNWTEAGLTFAGIAKSIDFGGTADYTGFDDITLGSAFPEDPDNNVPEPAPDNDVPEPAILALFGVALASMAAVRRRRAI